MDELVDFGVSYFLDKSVLVSSDHIFNGPGATFLCSRYVQRPVLGFGLILMIPAMRTTKSSLAWLFQGFPSILGSLWSRWMVGWHAPHYEWMIILIIHSMNHPEKGEGSIKFSGFPHHSWRGTHCSSQCYSTRLRLHEEVPVQLGFSSKLHQLGGGVCILLTVLQDIGESNSNFITLSNVL